MTVLSADPADSRAVRHVGCAFGLTIDAAFECPGLPVARDGATADTPVVRFIRVGPDLFPAVGDAETIVDAHHSDGRAAMRLTVDVLGGYCFRTDEYGDFHVAADGSVVTCAPVDDEEWRWQRFLVGQILPFLAVLHGNEVFHASAVRLAGRTVSFMAASRGGKSSLAVALVARGAQLITDDVMVLSNDDEHHLRVHHGFRLASVRHGTVTDLGAATMAALGDVLGTDDEAVRLMVDVDRQPPPVTDVFLLERAAPSSPLIEPIERVDPRLLLAAGYNYVIRTPDRLVQHLDICARLARTASFARIAISPDRGPREVAAVVQSYVESKPACP